MHIIIKRKWKKKNPIYKFFSAGLFVKIIGGISVVLIYIYYYKDGGDTINYYRSSLALINMASKDFNIFSSIIFGNLSSENYSAFDNNTGYPIFFGDSNSYTVVRLTVPFILLSGKSFIVSTMLLSTFTYFGIWRLLELFVKENKEISNQLAFSVLFIPSVFFWGSGILKDSYTLSATCWLIVSFYKTFIYKQQIKFHVIVLIIGIYVLLSMKPYIFYSSFAGTVIMYAHYTLKRNKNIILKYTILPLFALIIVVGGTLLMFKLGSTSGQYSSVDGMLKKASITQFDLKQDYYGGNSYDIGSFEPTLTGVIAKTPIALTVGLFMPFIWQAKNPVMLISGIENSILLFLFLYVVLLCTIAVFKVGFKYMLKVVFDNSLIVFSLVFSLTFAFAVGLTTANFGALVRYKIPLIPFFLSSLFYIIYKFNKEDPAKILAKKKKTAKQLK